MEIQTEVRIEMVPVTKNFGTKIFSSPYFFSKMLKIQPEIFVSKIYILAQKIFYIQKNWGSKHFWSHFFIWGPEIISNTKFFKQKNFGEKSFLQQKSLIKYFGLTFNS